MEGKDTESEVKVSVPYGIDTFIANAIQKVDRICIPSFLRRVNLWVLLQKIVLIKEEFSFNANKKFEISCISFSLMFNDVIR